MEFNEDGFPNYNEVFKKFDLDHNKELAEYIDYMYNKYYELLSCKDSSSEYKKTLQLFENEPDKQAVVQKLCDIYMKECFDNFKRNISNLFNKEEK